MSPTTDTGIKRVLLSWSSGKDSAWTLYQLQHDSVVEVAGEVVNRDGFVYADPLLEESP